MAKFTSIVYSSISGKVGGLVYQTSKNKLTVRMKVKGKFKASSKSSIGSQRIAYIAQKWRQLTNSERSQWNREARKGVVSGQKSHAEAISGYQLFCQINGRALVYQVSIIRVPGTLSKFPYIVTIAAANWSNTSAMITFSISDVTGTNYRLQIHASPVLSNGITKPSLSVYRQIANNAVAGSGTINVTSFYNAVYGTKASGYNGKVFIRVRIQDRNNGRVGAWVYTYALFIEP